MTDSERMRRITSEIQSKRNAETAMRYFPRFD